MADKKAKLSYNNILGGDVHVQYSGQEYGMKDVRTKVLADMAGKGVSGKISSLNLYVKPEEGQAYYVAKIGDSEFTGSVNVAA